MNNESLLRDWMFKAMTVEVQLDEFEDEGVAVRAATDDRAVQRVISLADFSAPIRKSAIGALPVYLAFFCVENSVRELVSERLTEAKGADWFEDCVAAPVQKKVQDRREKEGKNRWHTRRGAHDIYYTDFGDLTSIIRNNWSEFEDLFPDQNWIATRLDELEASRNVIAHSNSLDDRETERVRMYLQDWIRQVG